MSVWFTARIGGAVCLSQPAPVSAFRRSAGPFVWERCSAEDIEQKSLLVVRTETLGLQIQPRSTRAS
jgi:hypothetical protein